NKWDVPELWRQTATTYRCGEAIMGVRADFHIPCQISLPVNPGPSQFVATISLQTGRFSGRSAVAKPAARLSFCSWQQRLSLYGLERSSGGRRVEPAPLTFGFSDSLNRKTRTTASCDRLKNFA